MNGGDDKIPIGIQTFDKIIEGGYIYVDKTEYIYDIAHKYNYVFEFKVDSSAETALKQIDDKGYMIPFRFEDGKRLVKVGVNISTASRTLEDWIIDVANV